MDRVVGEPPVVPLDLYRLNVAHLAGGPGTNQKVGRLRSIPRTRRLPTGLPAEVKNRIESPYVILIIANWTGKENELCGVAGSVRDISDTTENFPAWFAKAVG